MSADFEPRIVAFACQFCGYRQAELTGPAGRAYPPNVHVIQVPCTGRVDIIHLLRAFEDGVDGVMVAACVEGNCHFVTGNLKVAKRVDHVKAVLGEMGINPDRLGYVQLCVGESPTFADAALEMTDRVRALGPTPVAAGSGDEWQPSEEAGA